MNSNSSSSATTQTDEWLKGSQTNLRKVLLRVVFWALGLAAAFGAAGVIFAGHDTLWRIVGTCAATAAGAFLILGASHLLDAEATWMAGMMAIALIVVEYLAGLGQTWSLFGSMEEPVGGSMVFLAATAVPAIVCARGMKRPATMLSARVGLSASLIVFSLLLVGAWGGWLGRCRAESWFKLGLALAVFAALAALCLIGAGIDRRHWRWLGVVSALAAFLMAAYGICFDLHETSALFVCLASAAAVVAHANLMSLCPLTSGQSWLVWGTIGAGVATGAFVDLASITRPWQEELLGRLAGAAAIIGGCGTLALLVLARIRQRATTAVTALTDVHEITLVCPRCRAKQTIAIGQAKCRACGLIIAVRVREQESESGLCKDTSRIVDPQSTT